MATETRTPYTPGSWQAKRHTDGGVIEIWAEGGPLIATVHFLRGGQQVANARLIATAPTLLEALKSLLTTVGGHEEEVEDMHAPIPESYLASARAAIEEAEA